MLLGLGLARRAMAAGLRALTYPRREPPPSETRPRDGHDWDLDVDLGNWAASGVELGDRLGDGGAGRPAGQPWPTSARRA